MAESAARMKQQQAQEEAERQALVAKVRAQLLFFIPLLDTRELHQAVSSCARGQHLGGVRPF